MKTVYIIGTGMSDKSITGEGMDAILSADILFGAPRLLKAAGHFNKTSIPVYKPDQVLREINESGAGVFAVLVSGDVGFFSGAAGLCGALKDFDVRLIPGISCVNAFAAKLMLPWQDFKLVSMHGQNINLAECVRRNRSVLCLTGGNAAVIGQSLCGYGFGDLPVCAGENLGGEDEKITHMKARDLAEAKLGSLTVLLIRNDGFDDRVRTGLSDGEFARLEGVPMTKSEVRAVVLSKLGVRPGDICYDVGAGTGSVTVEMALSAYNGHVYAIEQNEGTLKLIKENLALHHAGNATVVGGKAPRVFDGLPPPDAAFIGGSSGEIAGIVNDLKAKNPKVRVVAAAIAVESIAAVLSAFSAAFANAELVQIGVSRTKKAGKLHLMTAQNPVTIISGGGI